MNVLVVQREAETRAFLNNLLSNWGYDVAVAPSVDAAMTLLENFRFDALVSDLDLNDREALTAEAKRRQPWTVTVSLGASDDKDAKSPGRRTGGEHYLAKPVDPEALHALLAAA